MSSAPPDRDDRLPPCVVKIGGSLLDLPDLRTRLIGLPQLLGRRCLLVIGGGHAADEIRRLQPIHGLSNDVAHDLAIDAMNLNAIFVRRLLGEPSPTVAVVRDELRRCEDAGLTVPADWSVTSDSIAALVAQRFGTELVLAKSIAPPPSIDVAVARELVDPHFPVAIGSQPVSWINLRTTDPVRVRLR